jgi:type II secretion system protein N
LTRGKVESVFAKGAFYGGEIDGSFRQVDGMTRAGLQLNGVQIGRYRYLTGLLEEGQIAGKLSGAVTFEARGDLQGGRAAGELEIAGGGLQGVKINGFGIPDLNFSEMTVKFTVQGSKLEIEELKADGDELKVNGGGQVILRGPVSDSVLNLKLTIVPGENSPDSVKGLIGLIPRPNGARPDAPVNVTGTLKFPRFR